MVRLFACGLCALFALALSAPSAAQMVRHLSLDDAIELGLTQSPEARIARLTFEGARWNYRAFQAAYLPGLSFNVNGPGLTRSINSIDLDDGTLRYVEQSRTFSSVRLTMSQVIPLTGGEISVASGLNRVNNTVADVENNQWQASPLLINLEQPLFQFNPLKWNQVIEPLRFEVSRQEYVEDRSEIAQTVTQLFFSVYESQQNVINATFNVAVNDTIYTLSEGRYDIGRIAENDLLQSELQLINARTQLATVRIDHLQAVQELKTALGLPYETDLQIVPPLTTPALEIEPEEAVELARQNRPVFLDLELQTLLADQQLEQARKNSFSMNLSASYGLNESSEFFNQLYSNPLDRQQFNVSLQVPIFQWGQNRAQIRAALAERERTLEARRNTADELDQLVYYSVLRLQLLREQVSVAAQADTIATRRFEVARQRYRVGNIDITDLFNAQREKDAANQTFIRTLREFWESYYGLRRLTLYDFERRESLGLDMP